MNEGKISSEKGHFDFSKGVQNDYLRNLFSGFLFFSLKFLEKKNASMSNGSAKFKETLRLQFFFAKKFLLSADSVQKNQKIMRYAGNFDIVESDEILSWKTDKIKFIFFSLSVSHIFL